MLCESARFRKRSEYNTKNYKKNGYKSRIHDSQLPHGGNRSSHRHATPTEIACAGGLDHRRQKIVGS